MRGRERFGGLGQCVQVGRVDHQRPAGLRLGEGRGPAGAEQPGQHLLGNGVGAGADEDAFPGRTGGGGDGQQAGPGPFGRVDPAHAEGCELAAQHRVGLIQASRQD